MPSPRSACSHVAWPGSPHECHASSRVAIAAAAVAVFVIESLFIRGGVLSHERFGDVALYAADAQRMLDGQIPYRDFFFEYPPGALAAFIVPALISMAHYTTLFKLLMVLFGVATICVAAALSAAQGDSPRRSAVALGWIAISPLLLGPLFLDEYDLWPVLLTCLAACAAFGAIASAPAAGSAQRRRCSRQRSCRRRSSGSTGGRAARPRSGRSGLRSRWSR